MSEQQPNSDPRTSRHDISEDVTVIRFKDSAKTVALIANLGRFDGTLDEIIATFKASVIEGLPDFTKMTDDLLRQKLKQGLRNLFMLDGLYGKNDFSISGIPVYIKGVFDMRLWKQAPGLVYYTIRFNRPVFNRPIDDHWVSFDVTEKIDNAITCEFIHNASSTDQLTDLITLMIKQRVLNIQYVSDRFRKCYEDLLKFKENLQKENADVV